MADLSDKDSTQLVRMVGSDSSGNETNYVDATANGLKVDGSAVTQPVTGTGTAGVPATGVITVQGIQDSVPQKTVPMAPYATNSYPNPLQAYPDYQAQNFANDFALNADVYGNLQVRGPVITDEVSSRNDFSGSTLQTTLTGTVKFASNSTKVDGIGTLFTQEVRAGWYLRRSAGADTEYVQVDYVESDTVLYLVANYSGNHNNVAFVQAEYKPTVVGGASYTVGSSLVNLVSSTASGNSICIENQGDYLPFNLQFIATISQRIANQTAIIGFADTSTSPSKQAVVVFNGTNNTTVKFRTSSTSAASDTQETTVTLPNGAVTSASNTYQIDLVGPQAALLINGVLVATHSEHLPGPYDVLKVGACISNQAIVTSTTLSIDYFYFSNQNRLNVGNDFQSDPMATIGYGLQSNGTIKQLLVGTNGENLATEYATTKATYNATNTFNAANNPTDVFTLTGSATKLVRIVKVGITATKTTAGVADIILLRRSTANAGGTSTTLTATTHDSTNAAATAVARSYTANPTVGTLVGNIANFKYFLSTATTLPSYFIYDFGDRSQQIILRGTNEVFAVNLNAVTQTGNSFAIFIEWTEE